MIRDAIVEEVRAIRDEIAKRYDYDLDRIVRALQEASEREGRQLVSFPPKRVTEEQGDRKAS